MVECGTALLHSDLLSFLSWNKQSKHKKHQPPTKLHRAQRATEAPGKGKLSDFSPRLLEKLFNQSEPESTQRAEREGGGGVQKKRNDLLLRRFILSDHLLRGGWRLFQWESRWHDVTVREPSSPLAVSVPSIRFFQLYPSAAPARLSGLM